MRVLESRCVVIMSPGMKRIGNSRFCVFARKHVSALCWYSMMGSTRYRGLFLVLVLQHGSIHSLVPHVLSPRACRHGLFAPESPISAQTSWRDTKRSTGTMSQQSPPRDGTGRTMAHWHPVGARAMIATILATAVVFTGVAPAWEVAPGSMERSQRTARIASVGGVPSASAAGFNDEQRAIAETWVSVACGAKSVTM